jgi:glutamate-ammonia-ligase adenylyltransferase
MEASRPLQPTILAELLWDREGAQPVLDALAQIEPDLQGFLDGCGPAAATLINLLTFSPGSLEKVRRRPELLRWLVSEDVRASKQRLQNARDPWGVVDDPHFDRLREWKSDELLRIAFRDLGGQADLVETTADLTAVAERCVQVVLASILAHAQRRWGKPQTGFATLAMGKFGGEELNYSSDIDLIFFYGEDGFLNPKFSHHEYFARVAERIVETFSARGLPLFRIDMRLRPEGSVGPLARSLASMEYYYSGYGETWERLALIKARGLCGDRELLYEFSQRLQPFVFPRLVSADLLDEVAELKLRIERDLVGTEDLHRNVKLGFGGIREIEFTVQALQLLHGARQAFLQGRNTLKTLLALEQLALMPPEAVRSLREAYVFLRTVEHRLQMVQEQQTHTVPADAAGQLRIARSLGFASADGFLAELARHTKVVRANFERLLQGRSNLSPETIPLDFFRSRETAERALEALERGSSTTHVSARNKRLYRKLKPQLLRWLALVADPDTALTRFVRFVDGYGIRGALFETVLASPRLLELLVRLFDASASFSETVIRRPQLIEEIARGRDLSAQLSMADFRAGLIQNDEGLEPAEWVRVYRRAEMTRLVLKDVLGLITLENLQQEMTDLAEACIEFCARLTGPESDPTVLALGKFGGQELLYGADLDVVFVGGDASAAEKLVQLMNAKTHEGRVFTLDTRLRPEGEAGALVNGLDQYRMYFQNRAQLWEVQALTKARVLWGPENVALGDFIAATWREAGTRSDLQTKIGEMYLRVVEQREKGAEFFHLKTGLGGLMAIEFITQYLQMRADLPEVNTLRALRKLGDLGWGPEADLLAKAYRFYRRLESALRRLQNSSVSQLPRQAEEQRQLAARVDLEDEKALVARYTAEKAAVHQLACKILGVRG